MSKASKQTKEQGLEIEEDIFQKKRGRKPKVVVKIPEVELQEAEQESDMPEVEEEAVEQEVEEEAVEAVEEVEEEAVEEQEQEVEEQEQEVEEQEEAVEEQEEEVEEQEEVVEEEVVEEKKRKTVTKESYLKDIQAVIDALEAEIAHTSKGGRKTTGPRFLRGTRNRLKGLQKDLPKVLKMRNVPAGKKVSGFVLPCRISAELAAFLKVSEDTTLSRTEVTNAICVYIKLKPDESRAHMLQWKHLNPDGKRDLQSPANKMIILPDEALKKLLRYDKYIERVKAGEIKKKVTDPKTKVVRKVVVTSPDLYYWSAQLLVKDHFLETIKGQTIKTAQA